MRRTFSVQLMTGASLARPSGPISGRSEGFEAILESNHSHSTNPSCAAVFGSVISKQRLQPRLDRIQRRPVREKSSLKNPERRWPVSRCYRFSQRGWMIQSFARAMARQPESPQLFITLSYFKITKLKFKIYINFN